MSDDKTILMHENGTLNDLNASIRHSISELFLKPVVSVIHGKDKGKIFTFSSSVTIGRGDDADFIIDDELISRIHIRVSQESNNFIVEDRNSTNGTYIDGNRITKLATIPGTVIHIGKSKLVFSFKSSTQIETEKELYTAATTDQLTGTSSRLWFMKRANEEINYAQNKAQPLTLIMMDIDHFKKVNDTFGHQAGDFVLQKTAKHLLQHKRENDLLGRYGGEEFILLLQNINADQAHQVSNRICKAIEKTEFVYNGNKIPTTVSIGVCAMPGNAILDLSECISIADKLLYKAKNNGRNRVEIAN